MTFKKEITSEVIEDFQKSLDDLKNGRVRIRQ
jgi:hypothetical protein